MFELTIDASALPGEITRLFLLPQLHDRGGIEANEGPRGVVAASNGIVFDLAGGCEGCIKVFPEVGDQFVIRNHHTGNLLLIYICNFHVLSHLLLFYIYKLHWNLS